MEKLRFIEFGRTDPFSIMAANEALFRLADRGGKDVGFTWIPDKSLIMGYSQLVDKELNVERCRELGFPITRRITGGGTAFQSQDSQAHYGFVARLDRPDIPFDFVESYGRISQVIIRALDFFGLPGEFKPVNDVLCNGKKISGGAQTRGNSVLLQHATLLTDFNIKEMLLCCNIPLEKISDKGIKSVEERVTDLSRELGRKVAVEETCTALRYGFEHAFDAELVFDSLSPEEEKLKDELLPKYSDPNWVFRYSRGRTRSAGSYEASPELKEFGGR